MSKAVHYLETKRNSYAPEKQYAMFICTGVQSYSVQLDSPIKFTSIRLTKCLQLRCCAETYLYHLAASFEFLLTSAFNAG